MEARGLNAKELISQAGLENDIKTSTMAPAGSHVSNSQMEDSYIGANGRPSSVAESRSHEEKTSDEEDVVDGVSSETLSEESSRRGSHGSRRGSKRDNKVGRIDAPETYQSSSVCFERLDEPSAPLSPVESGDSTEEDDPEDEIK